MATARALPDYLARRSQYWLDEFEHRETVGKPIGIEALSDLAPSAEPTSRRITDAALSLLPLAEQGPLFLWVHYYDVHEWTTLASGGDLEGRARYESVFRSVDRHIGRLLEGIERTLPKDRTVLALSADHGEYLGERGRWGHTRFVGMPAIHVPLVLQAPGVAPERRAAAVALVDLGPTLAGFAGAHLPGVDGCDLMTPTCRESPVHIVASDFEELAVVSDERMLVVQPAMQAVELFDYRRDPKGEHNLIGVEGARADRLLKALLGSPMARLGSSFLE